MPGKLSNKCLIAGFFACAAVSCGEDPLVIGGNASTCENACLRGATRCYDSRQFEACIVKSTGCAEWSEPQLCPGQSACSGNACQNCPDAPCSAGEKSCTADGARVCGDFDGDGCAEWSEYAPCAAGCDGNACKTCPDAPCAAGEKSCDAQGARTCGDFDGDGCAEWSEYAPCAAGCDGNACKTCPDAPCAAGEKSCDAQGARTCGDFDGDGCAEWSEYAPCAAGCDGDACKAEPAYVKTRYPGNAILSPITPYAADKMRAVVKKNTTRNDQSFMKMGDSHMYSQSSFMYCFSEQSSKHSGYNLAGLDAADAVAAFQSAFDAFARVSSITILGETANLPIKNDARLLKEEIAATNPRFAFYGYGTNDMGWYDYRKFKTGSAAGYFSALELYFRNVLTAVGSLIDAGIVPLIIGTGWRNDKAKYYNTSTYVNDEDSPKHFVTTFNAVSRGIAEYYQIPYYNLQLSHETADNYGLSSDGIHHLTRNNGCDFTSYGLEAGANRRNRYAIEMLRRAWRVAAKGDPAPDSASYPYEGEGTHDSPFVVGDLPYTHMDTTKGGEKRFDAYGCNSSATEYGPEKVYRLTVTSPVRIRAFAMSSSQTDADIHLLTDLSANACRVRGDKWVESELSPGTYYFVVDTYNATGDDTNAGLYLFGIHACDSDDAACGSQDRGE